jgi:hypothetical protein
MPQHDYRDFLDNPKVLARDILIWLCRKKSDKFLSSDVAKEFDITVDDACVRLARLKKWNCIKKLKAGKSSHEFSEWFVTEWGEKCAERWDSEIKKEEK